MNEVFSDIKLNKIHHSLIFNNRGYGNLPQNILLNIFQYFDEEELRTCIIPVCQQWRNVAENPILWRKLKFLGKQVDTSTICDSIWKYNKAENIYLKGILEPIVVLRRMCRCLENLQYLTLRHCSEIPVDTLRHVLIACKNLKSLDLKASPINSPIFYEELPAVRNLISINLSQNVHLTISNIMTVAINCRKLEEFHLSTFKPQNNYYLSDSDCYFVLASIIHDLRSLSLDCSTLDIHSFSFVLRCKHLRYLCLNYAYHFEGSLFETIWKNLPLLTTLKVRFGYQITDANMKNLFEEGRNVMVNLEVIDFTGCSKLSDGGINAIANCCVKLKSIVLRSCQNVRNLRPIIQNCKNLEMLNIAFCENLKTHLLPVLTNLKVLFISDQNNVKMYADKLKENNDKIIVKICLSEYNKNVIIYN